VWIEVGAAPVGGVTGETLSAVDGEGVVG
jgi:hypothetical protein